jgi:Spy/CpxP family protein refolding chaperone
MRLRGQSALGWALIAAVTGLTSVARAQEAREIRPEVDLLKQSVSEKLQGAAEHLGLTQEQRDKIKETHRSFGAQRQALRDQRHDLYQSDLKSISEILTAEQRKKVDDLIEDRLDAPKADEGPIAWAEEALLHDSFAHRLRAAAEQLGLSSEQRYQIKERLAGSVEKYREQRRARRELVEAEFKAIAEVLSPEQQEKARRYLEQRLVTASIVQSVTARLQAAADKLGLTPEQRQRIIDAYKSYDEKYEKLSDDRRELLKSELKSVSEILTPEQREKVRNYFQDHVVMIDVQLDPNDPRAVAMLKETIAERLEATAEKLGLNDDQRAKIKAAFSGFAASYTAQREQRETLRKEELKAMGEILTPEQRETAKSYFADVIASP